MGAVFAQNPSPKPKDPPPDKPAADKQNPAEVEPPEEDESLKPKVYTFNPLQAQRDLRTGEFYYKKGSWKAAANRFEDATQYDPSLADAFLRLGEAREKLHDPKAARKAFQKYLELKPDSKEAASIKKKIGG
ncbi:MAG TPA: tetratricopeptide repeat protein [Bryobacteraceae bacterium]|jgi:tetratricopeptide (TPR) repeat protein